jgi:hypothetical protein
MSLNTSDEGYNNGTKYGQKGTICGPNSWINIALLCWRFQNCNCLRMVIPINYLTLSKNIIFNTKLLILNIDIVQFNYIQNLPIQKLMIQKVCTI